VSFNDYFSKHADLYAAHRPRYPRSLFEYLASLCHDHKLAVDFATGNGQSATTLVDHFRFVVATDASKKQIEQAQGHACIGYCVALSEQAPLRSQVVDLITISQALHWLNLELFFREVLRVLKAEGVFAAWCYNLLQVKPEVDSVLLRYYEDIVGPYWAPERVLVETGYETIELPFGKITAPKFYMEAEWNLHDLTGYLHTWSATQKYITVNAADPVAIISEELQRAWGDPKQTKHIRWPLSVRVGRKNHQ
jgi:SAM-dependent methyltransferase